MKFKNETGENAKYRLDSMKDCIWKTAHPGQTVDIPEHIGDSLKLTKIEEIVETKEDTGEKKIVDEAKVENEQEKENPEDDAGFREKQYKEKLISIKGVGKKSAEDIIKDYPTEEVLIAAIKKDEEIHNYDNVDAAVKKSFK